MSSVAVVVLNWNRPKDTIETLDSLLNACIFCYGDKKTDIKQFTIYIVDNASNDNSLQTFEKYISDASRHYDLENYQIKFVCISHKRNLGFAGGNNSGIKRAIEDNSDYLTILNNDLRVDERFFVEGISAFDDQKIGIVSPKIYFEHGFEFHKDRYKSNDLGNVIWFAGGDIDWNNMFGVNRGVDEVDNGQYDAMKTEEFATGAAFIIKKEALLKTGLFDERYFMYLEDVDYSIRVKANCYKLVFCPKAKIWHKVAQSSGVGSDLNDYFITRNRLLIGMNYAPLKTKLFLWKQAFVFLLSGRKYQKKGVIDYFFRKFEKGSWK